MSLFTSLFRRSERNRTFSKLMKLDDHLLRDIGLTRADLALMLNGRSTLTTPRGHE